MSEKRNKVESLSSNLAKSTRLPQSLVISYPSLLIISDNLIIQITQALEDTWIRVAVQMVDLCEFSFLWLSLWVPLGSERFSPSAAGDTLDLSGSLRVVALRLCVGGRFLLPADFLCHTMTVRLSLQTSFSGDFIFQSLIIHNQKTDDTSC